MQSLIALPPPPPPPPRPPPVATFPSTTQGTTYYRTIHANLLADLSVQQQADGSVQVGGVASAGGSAHLIGNFEYYGPDRYAVEFAGWGGPAFAPADKIAPSAEFERFRVRADQSGYFANLDLAREDVALTLTYSSFGNVIEGFTGGGRQDDGVTFFAAGSTTPSGSVPRSGTASFSGLVDGLWLEGGVTRRLYGSTARLTADFAAGSIATVLDLRGHDDPFGNFAVTPMTPLGTFSGSGSMSPSFNRSYFYGTFLGASGWSGGFAGHFFGPAAEEFGLSFSLEGAAGSSAIGAAVGKRD